MPNAASSLGTRVTALPVSLRRRLFLSLTGATVLGATEASYQVELASGKRTKVKATHVLLAFDQPSPAQLLQQASEAAETIDIDFLWECAPQDEFAFADLAREYFGHPPNAVEAASILLRLHGAPVYFHRKGRGRYRPAQPDILKAALAAARTAAAAESNPLAANAAAVTRATGTPETSAALSASIPASSTLRISAV